MKKFMKRIHKAHKIAKNECRWGLKEIDNFIFIYPFAYVICLFCKLL